MAQRAPTVTQLVVAAFEAARASQPVVESRWIELSFRLGSHLPDSLIPVSVQQHGRLDVLIRAMEAESAHRIDAGLKDEMMGFSHQSMFSCDWIGGCYEFLRAVRQRNAERVKNGGTGSAMVSSTAFEELFSDMEVLRIALEKHELPKDNQLPAPLNMLRNPSTAVGRNSYSYDRNNPDRAHIMPSGVSSRGSLMWLATNPVKGTAKWIERRDLSDRVLGLLDASPTRDVAAQ